MRLGSAHVKVPLGCARPLGAWHSVSEAAAGPGLPHIVYYGNFGGRRYVWRVGGGCVFCFLRASSLELVWAISRAVAYYMRHWWKKAAQACTTTMTADGNTKVYYYDSFPYRAAAEKRAHGSRQTARRETAERAGVVEVRSLFWAAFVYRYRFTPGREHSRWESWFVG